MAKKKPARPHILHRPHVHVLFSVVVVGILVLGTLFYVLSRPARYDGFRSVSTKNNNMRIDVPQVMAENFVGEDLLEFEHRQVDEGQGILSHIRGESQYIDKVVLRKIQAEIRRALQNQSGHLFEALAIRPLSKPDASQLKFEDFQKYKSTQINDGLVSNFSYLSGEVAVSGRLLIAFEEDRIYILIVEATDEIWQENQEVWQRVIDSFSVGNDG